MKRSMTFKSICVLIIAMFFISIWGETISYATPVDSNVTSGKKMIEKYGKYDEERKISYHEYEAPRYYEVLSEYEEQGLYNKKAEEIVLHPHIARIQNGNIDDILIPSTEGENEQYILWNEDTEWIEWEIDNKNDGLYEIEIEYKAIQGGTGRDIERIVYIDGELPFKEAGNIVLYRLWRESSEPLINNIGDEVWPPQEEIVCWNKSDVYDKMGMFSYPLRFHLTEGKHTIRFLYMFEPVMIGDIKLKPAREYINYNEYLDKFNYSSNEGSEIYSGDDIVFEAEENIEKTNDQMIRREEDQDPAVSPISRGARKLNTFGGWRWRKENQSATWEFQVPEDGFYNIGIKVFQTNGHGLPVYRRIEIDGQVPFVELNEYIFPFNNKWQMATLGDENGDYLFYLTKGSHTITMTNTMGSMADLLYAVENNTTILSKLLQRVFMLTGSEPDPNFDYAFEINIPDMLPLLRKMAEDMGEHLEILDRVCTQTPQIYNLLSMCKNYMQLFLSDRYKMASRVKDLQEAQANLTTVHQELQNAPISIDYFILGKRTDEWNKGINSNFFQRGYTMLYNFLRSFYVDYNAVSGMISSKDEKYRVINVWVGRGIEWAEILKNLADESFTPKSNIVLNINIIPAGQLAAGSADGGQLAAGSANVLLLSLAAGNAPDAACSVTYSSPVEFAIRDAAVDITKFGDYEDVAEGFLPEAFVPFKYGNGVYALPETMDFRLLFYRKDIIEELGITIPGTWEELYYSVLPVLYRNNMNFCYPPDYSPFLYQNDGSFYDEDGMKSALSTPEAFNAFNQYTFLYYGYGLPAVNLSFYQKFRTGETPMGIDGFETYMRFLCAAPEISGRWGVAPMLGTRKENGDIDRSTGGMANYSSVMFKKPGNGQNSEEITEKEKDTWEFLKWWTSYETQARYCTEVESLLGREARWNTANLQAYEQITWDKEHVRVMKEQWSWYKEIPVVLGGYFTSRHITNAWTNVVLSDKKPMDELELAVKEINIELRKKQEEFGIYAGN